MNHNDPEILKNIAAPVEITPEDQERLAEAGRTKSPERDRQERDILRRELKRLNAQDAWGRLSTDEDRQLKVEINNLIWMFGPKTLTLDRADEIAVDIFEAILLGSRLGERQ